MLDTPNTTIHASRPETNGGVNTTCMCFASNMLFLTFSVLVANPEKLLYTEANPARGLLNREKRTEEQSLAAHPTPYAARSEKKIRDKSRDASTCATQVSVRRPHKTRIPSTRRLGQRVCCFAKFYASASDNKFPSLVASLFSWSW